MLIENVKIINHNIIIDNADVEIKNGIISKITPKDGLGNIIMIPGFIDEHMHGFNGFDVMDGPYELQKIAESLASKGTTTFLPTWITNSEEVIMNTLSQLKNIEFKGSNVHGFHLEGPFVSIEKKGAHDEKYIISATKKIIEKYINASNNKIRKMTIAPENFSIDLLSFLKENNIIPSIGHTNVSADIARKYINNGVISATHLWNAMSGVSNRNPGVVEEVLINNNVYAEIIFDLIHVDKDALMLSIKSKGTDKIVAVTDSIKPAGLEDGDSISGGLKVTKKGNLITLKDSDTIAGSGATMYDNFKNIINILKLNPMDAVKLTSYNSARNLGINAGNIKENYNADFVLMDINYNIINVYIKGEKCK